MPHVVGLVTFCRFKCSDFTTTFDCLSHGQHQSRYRKQSPCIHIVLLYLFQKTHFAYCAVMLLVVLCCSFFQFDQDFINRNQITNFCHFQIDSICRQKFIAEIMKFVFWILTIGTKLQILDIF